MLILLDQDGVLADFHTGFNNAWAAAHPQHPVVPLHERRNFYMCDEYPPHLSEDIERLYTAKGFFRDLPPIPGAIEAVHALLERGFDVRICTSPTLQYRFCVPEKYEWVEQHLGHDFVRRMILTRDKTMVHGDVLVDDNPDITGTRTPSWRHVVFDQPYNRQLAGLRMDWSNWQEVLLNIEKEIQHGGA